MTDDGVRESAELTALIDRAAFLSAEQQALLALRQGDRDRRLDPDRGVLVLSGGGAPALACRAHLVGTAAEGPGTWRWGWADPHGFPPSFTALAERVRAEGERREIPELTTAELPLSEALPLRLVLAAEALTGLTAHIAVPVADGVQALLLIEHEALRPPAPSVVTALGALQAGLIATPVADQRAALTAWGRGRGADPVDAPGAADVPIGGSAVRLPVSDGALIVVLDARNRIADVRAELHDGLADR